MQYAFTTQMAFGDEKMSPPLPKKQKLDRIKCNKCRKDKVKCTPSIRKWPGERCQRCITKGEPCSEGRQANGKATKLAQEPITSISGQVGEYDKDIFFSTIQDWALLISYHQNITMAFKRLKRLSTETFELFPGFLDSGLDGLGTREFTAFFRRVHNLTLSMTIKLQLSIGRQGHPLFLSTLCRRMICGLSLLPVLVNDSGEVEFDETNRMPDGGLSLDVTECPNDIGAHFAFKIEQLLQRCRRNGALYDKEEYATFRKLSEEFYENACAMLKRYGLFGSMPNETQTYPLYIPEEFTYWCIWSLRGDDLQQDCLGRTRLHHYLDHLKRNRPGLCASSLIQSVVGGIHAADILGRTPLHVACQKNYYPIIENLLCKGADVARQTVHGSLPLHYAAANGSLDACKLILPVMASTTVNMTDFSGRTALHYALIKGHVHIVRYFLSRNSPALVDPNIYSKSARPPLFQAIFQDNEILVKCLLEGGADPNMLWELHTPFSFALTYRKASVLEALGAHKNHFIHQRDTLGRTLLHIAADFGFKEGVEYLLNRNDVDVNALDGSGETPVAKAFNNGRSDIADLFTKRRGFELFYTTSDSIAAPVPKSDY